MAGIPATRHERALDANQVPFDTFQRGVLLHFLMVREPAAT